MTKVLSADQLRELDAYTIEHEPISSIDLMERAATAVADAVCARWNSGMRVVVMAGPGNNGGDALATARLLAGRGYTVEVFLFNINGKLSPDCETNRQRLAAMPDIALTEVREQFKTPRLTEDTLLLDGLFGTGVTKPLTGGFAATVKFVNESSATVISIDMPSGLMCEDNTHNVQSHIVRADLTLTLQLPKLAHLLADNQCFIGELAVLDIGLSREKIATTEAEYQILAAADVAPLLKTREPFGHKGTFGSALLVAGQAGSDSMAGAAILSARACLRSGAGKVTVRTPGGNRSVLHAALPEAVLSIDPCAEHFSQAIDATPFTAVGIGSGIGMADETAIAFIEQVRHSRKPLLIDADGINI
ncbi:MAG: NAD(P)H-hydrate epimerase, partial [Alloprevotella sp.]|nr:NAD(P)H-hydrate epimerase [Alloprevotella sp.]